MSTQPITLDSIRARREADRVKPCRVPTWDEIDFLLALVPPTVTDELVRTGALAMLPAGVAWEDCGPVTQEELLYDSRAVLTAVLGGQS